MSYFPSITEKRRKFKKDVTQLLDKSDFCRDNTTLEFNESGKIGHLSKILD